MLLAALVDTRREYQHVFDIYVPIGLGVLLLFVGLIVFFAIRGRFRPPERAARWHENNPLEASYAVVLTCIVAFLLYVTFSAEHQVDSVSLTERPSLTVEVTGSKWEWNFYYPAYGITRRSGTVGRQPLVVPTDRAIRFNLYTRDVIHSFWIPELRFKRDLIPGAREVVVLDFDKAGRFLGRCAEYCGVRHSDMVFPVQAVSPARFSTWAADGGRAAT